MEAPGYTNEAVALNPVMSEIVSEFHISAYAIRAKHRVRRSTALS